MVEGNHCAAACAKASYSFIVLLSPAVNESTKETVNDESGKSVYVMSVYGKGLIRSSSVVFPLTEFLCY